MLKKIFATLVLIIGIAQASAVVSFKESKDSVEVQFQNIKQVKKVPFFDPNYVVLSLKGAKNLKIKNFKQNSLITDINVVKTKSDVKLVIQLANPKIKHKIKKAKKVYTVSIYEAKASKTAKKSKKYKKHKYKKLTKKSKKSAKVSRKKQKKINYENWSIIEPSKENIKPIKIVSWVKR